LVGVVPEISDLSIPKASNSIKKNGWTKCGTNAWLQH